MDRDRRVAEAVREECLRAAIGGLEDAGLRGLCAEGRAEAAISAIRMVDVRSCISRTG